MLCESVKSPLCIFRWCYFCCWISQTWTYQLKQRALQYMEDPCHPTLLNYLGYFYHQSVNDGDETLQLHSSTYPIFMGNKLTKNIHDLTFCYIFYPFTLKPLGVLALPASICQSYSPSVCMYVLVRTITYEEFIESSWLDWICLTTTHVLRDILAAFTSRVLP